MRQTLNGMRQRGKDDRGFTMIELLVVVVIIGVLVAIAVPVYLNYRKGAANKSAASDVRGAITAIEQYYTENGNTYPTDKGITGQGANMDLLNGQIVTVSPGNQLQYNQYTTAAPESAAAYKICGWNADAKTVYYYNSKTGGSVKKSASNTVPLCVGDTAE
jgi:type IV pilus assembly protein PilA